MMRWRLCAHHEQRFERRCLSAELGVLERLRVQPHGQGELGGRFRCSGMPANIRANRWQISSRRPQARLMPFVFLGDAMEIMHRK